MPLHSLDPRYLLPILCPTPRPCLTCHTPTITIKHLTGGASGGLHLIDVTNASRTLLMNIRTLQWSPVMLKFFSLRSSVLPKIVSSSEIYGHLASGALKGVPIAGIVGDQQAALVGNKCFKDGEAKNTYGTGAFLLFNTGTEVVQSTNGLLTTVAYQNGPNGKPYYALEGSSARPLCLLLFCSLTRH